jgi:peroxiredoxin Q/BCP
MTEAPIVKILLVVLLVTGAATLIFCGDPDKLAPGDAAPEFELPGSDGEIHRLSDHVGQRAVVIAWFPKAFTGG